MQYTGHTARCETLRLSVGIEVDLIHLLLQLDAQTALDFLLQLLLLLPVLLEHLLQLLLVIGTVLAKSLLDLIVCAKLRLQDSLPVFLLLDLFMNFGDLISSFADLLGLVAWVQDHIVVETLLEACLLSQEFVGLLLVLAQAVV